MAIRAVLFDKDGTLLDFDATFGPAGRALLVDLVGGDAEMVADLARIVGYDLATGTFTKDSIIFANATGDYAPVLADHLGIDCDEALINRIDQTFERHSLDHATLFRDAEATLRRVSDSGMLIGCITNDTEACARAQFGALGLMDLLHDVIGYDSGYGWKPGPGQIDAFAEINGLEKGAIAFVGDSLHDMHAARAAGVVAIAVTTGMHDADALAPHADHVVPTLAEIPAILGIPS